MHPVKWKGLGIGAWSKFKLPLNFIDMNKFTHSLNCLLLSAVLILTSCGYTSDKPVANQEVYKSDQLQTCKIDASKLGEIFKADQKEQIKCLQENFIQFTKYVRSKNPGEVSEKEITIFVRKFFEGQSDTIVKGLSLIFQLNMLLLRDEADRISRTNISPLFELLVHVNQEAIEITNVLKEMDDEKNQGQFEILRDRFNASIDRFTKFTLQIIDKSPDIKKELNIKTFIQDAAKKLGNKEIDQNTIDSLIFIKRILVGGDKEIITSFELETLVKKLPSLMNLSFNLYYAKRTNFDSDAKWMHFYIKNVKDLYNLLSFQKEDFVLITIDQLIEIAQPFVKDFKTDNGKKIELKKFKSSFVALKTKLVKGSPDSFSQNDLKAALNIVLDLLERNFYNNYVYDVLKKEIEVNRPLLQLSNIAIDPEFELSETRKTELHRDMQDIAINIRYFRDEKYKNSKDKKVQLPVYGFNHYRNKSGFMEASLLQWGVRKLVQNYGHKNAVGQFQVNVKEFNNFLNDMRPVLEFFELWSPNPETFARNAVLLADLFQNKSNGDLEVSELEAIEYIQMILSAVQVNDDFRKELLHYCKIVKGPVEPGFDTKCFNDHFYKTFLSDLSYNKFFPALTTYVNKVDDEEKNNYLAGVEGFARDVNKPEIPVHNRDNILILGAMINIESTMIRFDYNKDGVIDNKYCVIPDSMNPRKCAKTELQMAFEVYRKAIIEIGELDQSTMGYAYSIFLYLVKYKEKPPKGGWINNAKFLYFHWWESTNLIEAKRLNIGRILYYLVLENGSVAKDAPANARNKDKGLLSRVSELLHPSEQEQEAN